MAKRDRRLFALVGGMALTCISVPMSIAADAPEGNNGTRTYRPRHGSVSLHLDNQILDALGLEYLVRGAEVEASGRRIATLQWSIDTSSSSLAVELSKDASGLPWQLRRGRVAMRGALLLIGDAEPVNGPARVAMVDPQVVLEDDGGWVVTGGSGRPGDRHVFFKLSTVMIDFVPADGIFRLSGDLVISTWLSELLGTPQAADTIVGALSVDAEVVRTEGAAPIHGTAFPEGAPTAENMGAGRGGPAAARGPDVIVAELYGVANYGSVGGIAAFAIGTISCNIGDVPLEWFASTNRHPVIAQNMFRLKEGRFEHIGQSWLKHGFAALTGNVCGLGCQNPGTYTLLGVGCSDPYSAGLNGSQSILGPKSEVDAYTGFYPYPWLLRTPIIDLTTKRIQVHESDLDPARDGGGMYFIEGHYVASDDSASGNQNNNASYRLVRLSGANGGYSMSLSGSTRRQQPAIRAWKEQQPSVSVSEAQVPGEGLFLLAADATDLGNGIWRYEYAVQNLNSDRSGLSFTIPLSPSVSIQNIGFHDVDYHSQEPYDGTDWAAAVSANDITWSTEDYALNPNANALRWGTLYNFRFDADAAPQFAMATLGLFKPGTPTSIDVETIGPLVNNDDCNNNGVPDGVDITDGVSQDCNGNWIPDECEVFAQTPLRVARVAVDLYLPVHVTAPRAFAERLFIVEQRGLIKIRAGGQVLSTPFLDLSSIVSLGDEQGLLSMAFHPAFETSGHFYVNYTDLAGDTVIARYSVSSDPNFANPASGVILKTIAQDYDNHNGGQLQFGSDGYLYVGMGDGGSGFDPFNRAQDASTLLGKMLRLDVDNPPDYIPGDNPYAGPGFPLDEIWAFGLRNPWRFSFDRLTGDLYITDVGQDSFEEVNFQRWNGTGGANYGWRCMEGPACTGRSGCTCDDPALTMPIWAYEHVDANCSITGGYVYRGCAMPDLSGTYFYADYCSGFIGSFRYEDGVVIDHRDRTAELTPADGLISAIVSFGEDADGELYIVAYGGDVYKIVPDTGGPVCGDGITEGAEECDDGNTQPDDGCDENCRLEPGARNDDCANRLSVIEGTYDFDTSEATTDGPDEPTACDFPGGSQIDSDLWYCYTASCAGTATVSLCGSTFDTRIAVYNGCTCPTAAAAAHCNDDACGAQSEVSFTTVACGSYLIRVGGTGPGRGLGGLAISCQPDPINNDCNGNGVDDATDIACGTSFDTDGNGVPDECETTGNVVRGGRLYDRWWPEVGAPEPGVDHPLWADRPDQTSNTRSGSATWRCKECHGWDYKGVDGRYGTGSHRTGFPGILDSTLGAADLLMLLKELPMGGDGPGVLNGHDYGAVLPDTDIEDLVAFVLLGLIDDDPYINPVSADFTGDPVQGEAFYMSGMAPACAACHGTDGTAINFGTFADPEYVGTVAVKNPWEFIHKVRVGHPGAPMPSWIAGGGTNQGAADIGRHAQLSFPVDCIFDEQCDDGIACTDNVCGDEGRCVYVPSEGFCPSDGVFCNGPEICHVDLGCVASGNPCADPDACNEDESRCACDPPLVTAPGPRYLGVSPQPPDSLTPVALVVTPDCRGGVPRYVGTPDAGLLEDPVTLSLLVDDPENGDHLTPGLWGGTTYVTGIDVVPGIGYYVQADCGLPGIPSLSDPAYVVTQIWGDVMGFPSAEGIAPPNGVVDVMDMTAAVDGFRQLLTALPLYVLDLLGCIPDRVVTIVDIGATVDAFRGLSYADSSLCPTPCP